MLCLSLLQLQIKFAPLLRPPLLPAGLLPLNLLFFALHLQGLLGLRPNTGGLHLLSGAALPALGIIRGPPHLGFNSRTELQLTVVPEDKIPNLIVPGLRPKGNFAYGQFTV